MTYPQQYQQAPSPVPGALPFSQPSNDGHGGFIDANPAKQGTEGNVCGHLILVTEVVSEGRTPANDKYRPNEKTVTINFVDLDSPGQEHRENVVVKYPGLVNRLRVGAKMVLGRVDVQQSANGPFAVLGPYVDTDVPRAMTWKDAFERGAFAQPQAPAAPAPQAPQPMPQAAPTYPPQGQYPPGYGQAPQAPAPQPPATYNVQAAANGENPWGQQQPAPQAPAPQPIPAGLDVNDPAIAALLAQLPGAQVQQQ